jgi:HD-GYP domain-containing protein (c-di-GMP phosphodiesterase class II)
MKTHCEHGQCNAETLNLRTDISGFILYHHEWANGKGPFQKKEGEFPLGAALIGIADSLDVVNHLERIPPEDLGRIRAGIAEAKGRQYTAPAAEAMLQVLDEKMLASLRDDRIFEAAERFPPWTVDIEEAVVLNLAGFITRIIDDKSVFTQRHSTQIARKAWLMGGFYGYDSTQRAELYLAAALHDIGKLSTPVAILEKPGSLTDEEFLIIKDHVRVTYDLLKDISGFEKICEWAANHHEKLDGSGYPFGKKAHDLDFNSRLMACIDIYQAVSEERPYHPGRTHGETMKILAEMAARGVVEPSIVPDLDRALAEYSGKDVPAPAAAS